MLLSYSKDQGYQIRLRSIPASCQVFPGALFWERSWDTLAEQEILLCTKLNPWRVQPSFSFGIWKDISQQFLHYKMVPFALSPSEATNTVGFFLSPCSFLLQEPLEMPLSSSGTANSVSKVKYMSMGMIFSVVFGLRLKCPAQMLSSIGFKTPGLLVKQCEAAGFVFLNKRACTCPFATWLALHRCEQMALHLPPPCQSTTWNKHKEDSHCKLRAREYRGDKVGIRVRNSVVGLVLHLLYN